MMKNIISLTVLLAISAVVLTGCKNEEDDLSPVQQPSVLPKRRLSIPSALAALHGLWSIIH